MRIIIYIVIGIISGWLAGEIVTGGGFGLLGNLVVGLIGSVIGGFLLDLSGKNVGSEDKMSLIPGILLSTLGAIILLVVLNLLF